MPRKGWSHLDTPSGWYTVLRGPRPPSERWPVQQWDSWGPRSQWSTWKAPKTKFQRRWQRGITNACPPTPAEVQSAAIDRVRRLEAAIDALGAGSEEALCLEGVLAQAKRGASLAPVGERLDSTIKYVERCQKRLLAAEDAVKVAISSRDQAAAELEEGQRNLENLRLEAAAQASMVPDPGATQVSHPSHEADQISVLKARISELEWEQEEFRHKKAGSLSLCRRPI